MTPEELYAQILFKGAGRDIEKAKNALSRGNLEEFDTLFHKMKSQFVAAHSLRYGTRFTPDGFIEEMPSPPLWVPRPPVFKITPEQSDESISDLVNRILESIKDK